MKCTEQLIAKQDDIIMQEMEDKDIHTNRTLYVKYDRQSDDNKIRFYKALAVGPEVKTVKVGDVVMVSWLDTIPAFIWAGSRYTLTTEEKVIAILGDYVLNAEAVRSLGFSPE